MALIKSYSNYVLKKKHQEVNDGTIYERDITTIGGLDQFARGQVPIYRSNNFIITVRDDATSTNQYNFNKWEENENSGETWTLESIDGLTSQFEDDNDLKIVLKQDYYDFLDFAYYGSLTELFRASVTDIVARFPGELYGTPSNPIYYTHSYVENGEVIEDSIRLGGDELFEVSNPFGIDVHSAKLPKDGEPLKFFAEDGWKEYELFDGDSTEAIEITSWEVAYTNEPPCKGNLIAEVYINEDLIIYVYVGDDDRVFYLCDNDFKNIHMRPKEKHLSRFYNDCDYFEKILMNAKTTPKYKATFSVIKENEYGYYREFQDFIFPTTYGGYNIDATTYGFNEYTNQMIEVGTFYDEHFSDNLWRSMTHEAIKNFDWTYTRQFEEGDEEEYVFGGKKMQKALRVFAREFDETIAYINNIKSVNRVTYDERGNLPDYFLTDAVENEGWDVKLIYPYNLKEYFLNGSENTTYTENGQISNVESRKAITREFSQDSTTSVSPYSKDNITDGTENGYFISCCASGDEITNGETYEKYNHDVYHIIKASGKTMYDSCALGGQGVLKDRIKTYTDEKPYTFKEMNNEFLRRLKINSRHIWRHKGTVEGIEMILAMFGLKSERFAKKKDLNPDYTITEYSMFTNPIVETWDAVHQMYRIDWINSTKLINYDNRTSSSYEGYIGIPVAYKDVEGSYISKLTNKPTENENEAFTNENGSLVKERRLYPSFNKNEEYDGHPYFQMDGGWLAKKIVNQGSLKKYNFQYDNDNNIVATTYLEKGSISSGSFISDNEFLYKETVRNIQRVDSLRELLETRTNSLYNGIVFYVTNVEKNIMVIDGSVFNVIDEYYSGTTLHCIELIKNNGYIKVGNKFFDESITVYDKNGDVRLIDLSTKENGYSLYAYIKADGDFICLDFPNSEYSIETYTYVSGGTEGDTNYFVLDDINYSHEIAKIVSGDTWTSGWRRLNKEDKEYLKLNTINNYYEGNNPHNGNMVYDNGHEYFTYFKRLFKNPIDENMFDERCYSSYYDAVDDEISKYGFSGLIEDNEDIKQYDNYLIKDTKVHYFGHYKTSDGNIHKYTSVKYADCGSWDASNGNRGLVDEVTNQIVNNKRLRVNFKLHSKWFTQSGQEEMKYLDDVVMNYLTQMVPSSTILEIIYTSPRR